MIIEIPSKEALPEAARRFAEAIGKRKVFAFHGAMGAGKTTLIAGICRVLGVDDDIASPTFSIVNEYRSRRSGEAIYHFDFYRLDDPSEALDLGAPEYFDSGSLCFIEWPDRAGDILPDDAVDVTITERPDGSRLCEIPD